MAEHEVTTDLPIPPLEELSTRDQEGRRLWIGNLDSRITEFTLLKLVQKFGELEKFDFLYHKSGPDQGKPRGYCFATYNTAKDADKALRGLDGKLALTKKLIVRHAHAERQEAAPPALGSTQKQSSSQTSLSTETKIHAIETKLRLMERGVDGKVLPLPGTSGTLIIPYQQSAEARGASSSQTRGTSYSQRRTRPYHSARRGR